MFSGFIHFVFIVFFQWYAFSQCPDQDKVENQYIVKVNSANIPSSKLTDSKIRYKIKSVLNRQRTKDSSSFSKLVNTIETLVVETDDIDTLKKNLNPEYIQQDCFAESFSISSDPFSIYQNWYLSSLNAEESFSLSKQQDVVVAVVDTGVEINHDDLAENIWVNQTESEGQDGVDDDGNGFIDDIYGYDVADNDNNPVPTRQDFYLDFDHGTHITGLIGAAYNNRIGGMGLAKNQVKVMAVKGFKSLERTPLSDLLRGVYYAVDNGAHIINASWGATKPAEQAEIDAVNYALEREVLIVSAAGNSTEPASWVTPASIPGVITVASLNSKDQLSTFSNYGASVNFVAPGGDGSERLNESLFSTIIENGYDELRGTSMSAPLIAGSLALLMSQKRDLTPFMALRALNTTSIDLRLRPYTGRGEQIYRKANLKQALEYVNRTQSIQKLDPRILTIISDLENEEAVELSSTLNSGGTGGCGLQSSSAKKSGAQGHSLAVTLLFIFPSMLTLWLRRKKL